MYAYLVMVTPENHNKFYQMRQVTPTTFEASWGRVGAKPSPPFSYPMTVWDRTLESKLQKGYQDQTNLHSISRHSKYQPIENPTVRSFFEEIEGYSSRVLERNYTVSFDEVTQEMVDNARKNLSHVHENMDIEAVNEILLDVFCILPRKMKHVQDYLVHDKSDLQKVLKREYDLLDIMAARATGGKSGAMNQSMTILEHLGLTIDPIRSGSKTETQIKKFMGTESSDKFVRAFRVRNKYTDDRFYKFMKENDYSEEDVHYLYHGSRNENWYGLMKAGPLLAPKNVVTNGKAFGNGIYFANRAKKSMGYSSLRGSYWTHGTAPKGFLAVYKVLFKDPKFVQTSGQYSLRDIRPHDAVFAKKGITINSIGTELVNDEIIIFREDQATLQYILEIS